MCDCAHFERPEDDSGEVEKAERCQWHGYIVAGSALLLALCIV